MLFDEYFQVYLSTLPIWCVYLVWVIYSIVMIVSTIQLVAGLILVFKESRLKEKNHISFVIQMNQEEMLEKERMREQNETKNVEIKKAEENKD